MQKLKEANLYRSELLPVSGKLVPRYNDCLLKLGFSKTKLKTFSIDGIGWSPEIAEEKKDIFYLNNGLANPHGILISPLQKGKPVYVPTHSYDREMMRLVFKEHGDRIKEITRDSAICLDFDQNIDAFYEPLDVLKYNEIQIHFHFINQLKEAQLAQLKLIELFNTENNFIDEKVHGLLLKSAKKYGDLRSRDLELHTLSYTTTSFYTKAFGGIYVLRDFVSPMVIFEDEKAYKLAIQDTTHEVLIYLITQPELVAKLKDHIIVSVDLQEEIDTKRYERVKKYLFSKHLKKVGHPIDRILNDTVLFKSYLNKIDLEARKEVMGVEIYLDKLEINNQFKIQDIVDPQFFHALHKPHSSLDAKHQDLIWKLLVTIAPEDVLHLFWYDKEAFYAQYQNWEPSLQEWVIDTIRNNI